MFLSRAFKVLLIAIVAFAFVSAAYAFDAKNTFGDPDEAGRAGEGSGGISGYDITNVTYTLDESFPANIIAVSFDLAPDTATTVRVSFNATSPTIECDPGTPPTWTCSTGLSVPVKPALLLNVIAYE